MPELALDPETRARECARKFGDKLLGRIGATAKASRQIAVEPGLVAAPMTEYGLDETASR